MIKIELKVPFKEGLHARPASELVKICQKSKSSIQMTKGEMSVNPKSILGIMALGAATNDEIVFIIEGEDEETIESELKEFFTLK